MSDDTPRRGMLLGGAVGPAASGPDGARLAQAQQPSAAGQQRPDGTAPWAPRSD